MDESSDCEESAIYINEYKPQKCIVYNKYLPYASDIPDEIVHQVREIKQNLSKAVLFREIRPGCTYWSARLGRFIRLYGMCFSKEDHILFVKLLYELVIIPDQEFIVTEKFAQILSLLLKKRKLISPDDLKLDWKPLYESYHSLFLSSARRYGMIQLPPNSDYLMKSLIRCCHPYFHLSATSELLEKWRPHFCPFDQGMNKAIATLEVFLPTILPPDSADLGWKLWLDELLHLWNTYTNEPTWHPHLFCLFARLAWHNIGYIDWEKHLPSIFTRVLRKFNLPVAFKNIYGTAYNLSNWSVAWFIVANLGGQSKSQDYLDQMFKALISFYHPSNAGSWTRNLQDFLLKLSQYFVQRLHHERHEEPSWKAPTPEWKKLSDDDIQRFVKCLLPATQLAVFSKTGSYDAGTVMHRLALLSPDTVIPPLIEQLYVSIDTMTEPHRLTSSLHCVVRVARPLVLGGAKSPGEEKKYPEGPTHVLPLLILALPGIDPNDINKCMTTFQFIATFISLVPLVDCSSAPEEVQDLSEIEQQICLQSAGFSDFVMQFMDKCFALIESSALEQTTQHDSETESMNMEENMIEIGLLSAFKIILTQSHPKIFDEVLDRLVSFTKGRCMETKVSGKFISTMFRAAAKVDSEKTLKAFLPSVSRLILTLTESVDIQEDENLDNEILFNLLLISEVGQSKGKDLVKYLPILTEVLKRTLHLKCRKGYKLASSILRNILWSLTPVHPNEVKSSTFSWEAPFSEFLPIKHWGEAGNLDALGITWSEPGEEEEKALIFLINEFLTPELELLQRMIEGDTNIERERFYQSLVIILDMLYAGAVLPLWDEEPIDLVGMSVQRGTQDLKTSCRPLKIELNSAKFPKNVRLAVAETLLRLVDSLIERGSDDTKAMNYINSIYMSLVFFHGVKKEEYEKVLKNFQSVKYSLADSIVRKKQHIRALLIERVALQHERRVLLKGMTHFSNTHDRILRSLWKLSISHYGEVKRRAQQGLTRIFQQFIGSYKLLLPDIIDVLKKDPEVFHKEMKGALFVILSYRKQSLIVRRDWNTLNAIWPALLASPYSEKPSVIRLYDGLLRTMAHNFELFAVDIKVTDGAMESAKELLCSSHPEVKNTTFDSADDEKAALQLSTKVQVNRDDYHELVRKVANLIDSGDLHWRRVQLGLTMLWHLVRPDIPFPAQGVKTVVQYLLNENIILRKISLGCMPWILKNQKRPHKKIILKTSEVCDFKPSDKIAPGDNRPDNRWLQYDSLSINMSESEWEERRFVHKTYHGWYCWPSEIEVYAPLHEQPPIDRPYDSLTEAEKAVYDFFICQSNVDSLISYLSLEEYKGIDKFNKKILSFHKGLFRNFGDAFLPLFESHLERLVSDSIESNQRCAAEIIAGLIRATKHWPYKKVQYVMQLSSRLVKVVFSKVMNETLNDWATCFASLCCDRDPNQLAPLMEIFLKEHPYNEEGSFLFSSRLYLLHRFLEQQEWRIAKSFNGLYEMLKEHFASPYKTIRDNVATVLFTMFVHDQNMEGGVQTCGPHISDFVEYILPRVSVIIQEAGNGGTAHHIAPSFPSGDEGDVSFGNSLLSPDPSSLAIEMSVGQTLQSFAQQSRSESPEKDLQEMSLSDKAADSLDLGQTGPINLSSICDKDSSVKMPLRGLQGGGGSASGNGFLPGTSEERKNSFMFMNTLCKYLRTTCHYANCSLPKELYNFLPHLCQLESINADQELRNNCITSIGLLSAAFIHPDNINFVFQILQSICLNGWWRSRMAALSAIQVILYHNMFTAIDRGILSVAKEIVVTAISDPRAEVRQMASLVLSGLFHCNMIPAEELLTQFLSWLRTRSGRKSKSSRPLSPQEITLRHSGALGIGAYIKAHPYEVPDGMTRLLIILTEHISDPPPISSAIKECLRDFHRTHYDNWQEHKKKFSNEELSALTDILVSPSYYA